MRTVLPALPEAAHHGGTPRLPGRFGWVGLSVLGWMLVFTVTRVVVAAIGGLSAADGPIAVTRAFLVGAAYDLLASLWLSLPLLIYVGLARTSRYHRPAARRLRRVGAGITLGAALFGAVAEVLFFAEFDGRFNFVAVDYLIYPTEVATNIWESYHVAWVLLAIAAIVGTGLWLARRPLARLDRDAGPGPGVRGLVAAGYVTVLAALTWGLSPDLARVSDDRALNEVAGNGYVDFVEALLGQDAPWEGLYPSVSDSIALPRVRRLVSEGSTVPESFRPTSIERAVRPAGPARDWNVVLVLEESFGAAFVGTIHPRPSGSRTPAFDALADSGTLLTHAFATGNRTIRALEATTASLPPLPGVSIVRRTQSVDLFTLPALLRSRGYTTEFIYGGRAFFDGMGSYLRHNGIDRVVDQGDFPDSTFRTAWGVADEAIFDRTLTELDALHSAGRPFYALVLTVSNHRPYTYPAGRIAADPAEKRRVNAVQYADWALGRFMRQARDHAFFDHTLFVLMGDHGARVYGAGEIPLPSYEVPILFYAPRLVPAGLRVGTLTSSLDVPPTILGLLGAPYESKFFGRDVLHEPSSAGRALMTHNSEVALLRDGRMAVLGLHGATTVYAVDSADGMTRVTTLSPADRELVQDAIASYTEADRMYRRGGYRFDARLAGGSLSAIATPARR